MQHETDVPILLGGLLDLTALLPLVPVAIGPTLHDIFDIFLRMATFNLKKPGRQSFIKQNFDHPRGGFYFNAGSVPDVYLLHLQVGTYSLFHRLYGMYPCHFLTYLRSAYSRKENEPVFQETIKVVLVR